MNDQPDKNKILFAQLVMMFATSALQGLGRIPHPATGKTEADLDAAQSAIDLLDMLDEKTSGNLDEEEAELLKENISTLKMQYVQARQASTEKQEPAGDIAPESTTPEPTAPASEAPSAAPKGDAPDIETTGKDDGDDKQPRFHKSYG